MNITVYLGANEGNDPALHKAVTELGAWIGQSGNTLVYCLVQAYCCLALVYCCLALAYCFLVL